MANRGSRWYFLVQTLSAAVALRGSDAKVFGTRNPGTSNASTTRSCLYWHRSIASFPWLTVSQGRNRRGQGRFDKSGSPNFLRTVVLRTASPPIRSLSAAPQYRLRCYATPRHVATHVRYSQERWHARQWRGGSNLSQTW
jgi:hypothetical protein